MAASGFVQTAFAETDPIRGSAIGRVARVGIRRVLAGIGTGNCLASGGVEENCPILISPRWHPPPPDDEANIAAGKKPPPSEAAAWSAACSLLDLVDPIADLGLRGLDVDVVLFAGGGDEAAHAVRLPIRGRPDLGQGGALGASDQLQDPRTRALLLLVPCG